MSIFFILEQRLHARLAFFGALSLIRLRNGVFSG